MSMLKNISHCIIFISLFGMSDIEAIPVPIHSNRVVQTVTTTTTTTSHFAGDYTPVQPQASEDIYVNNAAGANAGAALATGAIVGVVAGALIASNSRPYYAPPPIFFPFPRPIWRRYPWHPYPHSFVLYHHFHPGPHYHPGIRRCR